MARVPYVSPDDLSAEKRPLLDTLSDRPGSSRDHGLEGGTLNVYRALAQDVDSLEALRSYSSTLWRESGLDPHEREFVLLATAHAVDSEYEWQQHVRVALDEGLSRDQIRAVTTGDADALAPAHAELVSYVHRFVDGTVDDDAHDQLVAQYEPDTVQAITMLSGHYLGLARMIDAFDVETEADFVGWQLETLPESDDRQEA